MTVEQRSWTINTEAIESNVEWGEEWFLPKIDIMVREGVLVPDDRLQAIADIWGKYKEEETSFEASWDIWVELTKLLGALLDD